eukprot:197678_1
MLHIIYVVWIISYVLVYIYISIIFFALKYFNQHLYKCMDRLISITLFIIFLTTCCLEIKLINDNECEGQLLSLSEAICLLIVVILSCLNNWCIFSLEVMADKDSSPADDDEYTRDDVSNLHCFSTLCGYILFIIEVAFVMTAINNWSQHPTCNNKLRLATLVLLFIWITCCGIKLYIFVFTIIQKLTAYFINKYLQ